MANDPFGDTRERICLEGQDQDALVLSGDYDHGSASLHAATRILLTIEQ